MIRFTATILRFDEQGEKSGWSYLPVPADLAAQLKPGSRKSFRVRGSLDTFPIKGVSLVPVGDGNFILPFNATMRRGTGKRVGASVVATLEPDSPILPVPADLSAWLEEDEAAKNVFLALPQSHKHYWIKWLESVKTTAGREARLARAVAALSQGFGFAEMLRAEKAARR